MGELLSNGQLVVVVAKILESYKSIPIAKVLHEHNVLQKLIMESANKLIFADYKLESSELNNACKTILKGLPISQEYNNPEEIIKNAPDNQKQILKLRYQEIIFKSYLDKKYSDLVDPYFLERRAALERVVYGVIRVSSPGIADELFLRIIDSDSTFGNVAMQYSEGDEKLTKGMVGPVELPKVLPQIRQALERLSLEEIHPPIKVDRWYLILKLVHKQPARMNANTRYQLMKELYEQDLGKLTSSCIKDILE